ncbi:DNA gyrase [Operophtera brumata]|uniref:DNA gyrase n=1 Tax=Operophtera brumata TaxID=104452 RepID=A0A0L7LBL7_OPEBR|nr:DNA gyrase [Operophtera brumata]
MIRNIIIHCLCALQELSDQREGKIHRQLHEHDEPAADRPPTQPRDARVGGLAWSRIGGGKEAPSSGAAALTALNPSTDPLVAAQYAPMFTWEKSGPKPNKT